MEPYQGHKTAGDHRFPGDFSFSLRDAQQFLVIRRPYRYDQASPFVSLVDERLGNPRRARRNQNCLVRRAGRPAE